MDRTFAVSKSVYSYLNPTIPAKSLISPSSIIKISQLSLIKTKTYINSLLKTANPYKINNDVKETAKIPTISDVLASSKAQNLLLQLQTLEPFFRITARSLETDNELGRAEGLIRVWLGGRVLHLDSIGLRTETLGMEKSIFGVGLFIGAVAVRYGYDCGCRAAELLAINDSDLYHSKLARFYQGIGFKIVHEVTGSTIGDWTHMLVLGGIGPEWTPMLKSSCCT